MLFTRVLNKAKREVDNLIEYFLFYFNLCKSTPIVSFNNILNDTDLIMKISDDNVQNAIKIVTLNYLEHRFDLLGSGWVENSYHAKSLGCIGLYYDYQLDKDMTKPSQLVSHFHKRQARKIENFISKDYKFIDWQRDIKSGYRWDVKKPYFCSLASIGKNEGVDIKLPWELSRLQHLPQLAFFVKHASLAEQNKAKLEFQNVALDFIASNPVGMGVNWACAMDVAIRVSNLIVAKCLFANIGEEVGYSNNFENIFNESVYLHGKFVFEHLEYNKVYPERNNNHYLSNISGLVFTGAYLLGNEDAERWFDFAKNQLLDCLDKQFHDDGSNFEASTSYHRLSGELVIYPIAILLNIYGENWVNEFLGKDRLVKLFRIGQFTKSIMKPDNTIPQIGDNDSGRFFKIDLQGNLLTNSDAASKYKNLDGYLNFHDENELFWDQNCLDHSSFVDIFDMIFESKVANFFEAELIAMLSGGAKLNSTSLGVIDVFSKIDNIKSDRLKLLDDIAYEKVIYHSSLPLNKFVFNHFPDFGLSVLRCDKHFYCSIYSGGVGQSGNGGHAHADFGSYDLIINGIDITKDPGTFLYTASKKWRNIFRRKLHNGICKESYDFPTPFSGRIYSSGSVEYKNGSLLVLNGNSLRLFSIDESTLVIYTRHTNNFKISDEQVFISPGYGKLIVNEC